MKIRAALPADDDAIWKILEPVFRAGETYPIPRDIGRDDALAYWRTPGHSVFVAEENGAVAGTYYLRANNKGGGSHVANCGYVTGQDATGRGIARAMCLHSLDIARERGFKAMQFNFVISTNERAVKLWRACGFEIAGRLPGAFRQPGKDGESDVDALVMYRTL
jgi:ribosomal protein S18 acetylase RimI-like enzyme